MSATPPPGFASERPISETPPFLKELWYYALPGHRLKRGQMLAKTLLDTPVILARDKEGEPFALLDLCPHRAMPLRHGWFDGTEVECCYHGWRFDREGVCTAIPSLVEGQGFDPSRVRVRRFPLREVQGNLWIFMGEDVAAAPPPPVVPGWGEGGYNLVETVQAPVRLDEAVVGLMDPAHGPFVHRSWWWRSRKSMHEKAKQFAPSDLGFTMVRHTPSSNSRAYKLLGGRPETEIAFRLPGVRIETVQVGRHFLCNFTAITPLTLEESEINHAIYWTMPWLGALKPLLRPFVRKFLNQDRAIMERQKEGLRRSPGMLLVPDADTQARWYYRLKNEFARAHADERPFDNPVRERTLKWRS